MSTTNQPGTVTSEEWPALVVGAGPAGLTAAITLARSEIPTLLVERRPVLSSLPRATAVSLRTMELMRTWGLEEKVRAGGPEVEWLMWSCETLASAPEGFGIPVGIPSREASSLISPTRTACVPQDHLESVLIEHLRSLPAARVELGTELIGIDTQGGDLAVTLRDASGGTRLATVGHLVGADGAHGPTRRILGIEAWESVTTERAVSALFRAPLWEVLGEHRYALYSMQHPEAPGLFLPAGVPDRWLYAIEDPSPTCSGSALEGRMREHIRIAAGIPRLEPSIERTGRFSLAVSLAESFRRGNAHLVGDAAHRVTPRGGTGMNMAIKGAFNLGWKLAWVIRGWAPPSLLDSYESEQRPVALHNIERSADPEGARREPGEEVQVDLGGRIPHLWTTSGGVRRSTLDLLGDGLTLLTRRPDAWRAAVPRRPWDPYLDVQRVDELAASGLGIGPGDALAVRPDGVSVARIAEGEDPIDPIGALLTSGRCEHGPR